MRWKLGPILGGTAAAFLLLATPARALDPALAITQYRQDVWDTKHGLPQSSVEAILQGRDGYLWLGTQEGLARFDGVRFVVFDRRNTHALRHNRVMSLHEDRAGALWIGTEGGGITRLRDGAFTTFAKDDGLPAGAVRAIAEDAAGTLWVGTASGLARREGERFQALKASDGLPSDVVRALAVSADGTLWVGTSKGLATLRGGRIERDLRAGGAQIMALWIDPDGTVWAGTRSGLLRLRGDSVRRFGKREGLPFEPVHSLWRDRQGSLWLGTEMSGLARLVGEQVATFTEANGLPNNNVLAVREDREGNVWVGTQDGGLTRLAAGKFVPYGKPEGLAGDVVWPVLQDRDGGLWLGTNGSGLSRLRDGAIRNFTTADGLSHNAVQSLAEGPDGALWIGTRGGGLDRLMDGRFTNYSVPDGLPGSSVSALLVDRSGVLWVGTRGDGLARFKDGAFTRYSGEQGLPDDTVHFIHEDRQGALWLATNGGGLVRFRDGVFQAFTTADGLSNDIVNTIHEDADGTLWIGTYGGGLVRYRDGRFTPYTVDEGLYDNAIFHILEDDAGNLWMSCNKGIFRVSKKELDAFAGGAVQALNPVVYGTDDGMRHRECNGANQPAGFRTRDGRLWFPTIRGVVAVDPTRLVTNPVPPPVVVEQVGVEKRYQPARDHMEFGRGSESFEFHYTAPSFALPERVRFRYKLENLDRGWVDAGTRRTAYYTRIPPGTYRFVVTAANDDGVWNEQGTAVDFTLAANFYNTPWFVGLFVAGVSATVWGGSRLYGRRLRRREQTLVRLVEDRTQQLEMANRALARLSSLDGLTEVANRRAFDEAFEVEWRRASRTASSLALILVDIDHFKAYNDTYGHQGGDDCLRRVAATLGKSAARAGELVARYGGEEFVVLLPSTDGPEAAALAETLRARVEALGVPHASSASAGVVTLSLGVAATVPGEGRSPADLLKDADGALYAAKRGGRNRVVASLGPERLERAR